MEEQKKGTNTFFTKREKADYALKLTEVWIQPYANTSQSLEIPTAEAVIAAYEKFYASFK